MAAVNFEERSLGELVRIEIGRTPSRSNPKYWGGHQDWLTISDFEHGDLVADTTEKITEKAIADCGIKIHAQGTLVMSFKLTIGRLGILAKPMATNEAIAALIPFDESQIDTKYLYHFLSQYNFDGILDRAAKGKTLNKAKLTRLPIRLPGSLAAQQSIASILDKADSIRRKQENALEMADALLKSSFLDMFGDPVANPKMWHVRKLSQQASIKIGYPFQSKLYSDSGIRLCRGANILPGGLDWSDVRYWPKDDALRYEEFALEEGDVILALDRPWISSGLKVAQVRPDDLPAFLVQRAARIRGKSRAHSDFIYQALTHPSFWQYCTPTETTVPHISPIELRDYPTIEPDVGSLEKFGLASAMVLANRKKIRENFEESIRLFSSLSQRAFCGEL